MHIERAHRWLFIRSGGVDQVVIRSGADVVNLESLDQKLWVALACPTRGIEIDPRTLDLIDTDHDGRIRPPELIAATQWVGVRYREPDDLLRGGDELDVDAIDASTTEGRELRAAIAEMHDLLGTPRGEPARLAALAELSKRLTERTFNGDGVIVASQLEDAATRSLVEEIGSAYGVLKDRSGENGIDRALAERFLDDVERLQRWYAAAGDTPAIEALADRAVDALERFFAVEARIDDYFVRCELAAYDPLAAENLNPPESLYRALALKTLTAKTDDLESMPLAVRRKDGILPLDEGVNPAWRSRLDEFRRDIAEPLLGRSLTGIDRTSWHEIRTRFAACSDWLRNRPDTPLAKVTRERIVGIDVAATRAAIHEAIRQDEAAAAQNERFAQIERLLHFQRDLVHLLNNFVSFAEFYAGRPAIFEAGRLYLDARSCDLTVHVAELNKHPALAGLAKAYLAYCECKRGEDTMHVVAVFTAGDVDYLLLGRNGVFYDRKGRDWDATIVKIVENPIGIRQAFFAPYKKFVRMIEEQVAKRAAASEAGVQGRMSTLATTAVQTSGRPAANAPAATVAGRRIDVGTVAALGVALGSLSTVLVAIFAKFVDLGWWIPVAVLCIVLAISGPSMLIAWLKLRQRSLGPILDASGWAINGRMKINMPLGAALSKEAKLPPGADHRLRDPYAETHPWRVAVLLFVLALSIALGWRAGSFDRWLPMPMRSGGVAIHVPMR